MVTATPNEKSLMSESPVFASAAVAAPHHLASEAGRAILAEGAAAVLGPRDPNRVYEAAGGGGIRVLPRNYRLSDDISFRFSRRDWEGYPLTAA